MNTSFFTNIYNTLVALGIVVLTIGLVLIVGRIASRMARSPKPNRWGQLGMVIQILIVLNGIVNLVIFAGFNTAIILLALAIVALSAILFYRPEIVTDRLGFFHSQWDSISHSFKLLILVTNREKSQPAEANIAALSEPAVDTQQNTAYSKENGLKTTMFTENSAEGATAEENIQEEIEEEEFPSQVVRQYAALPGLRSVRKRVPSVLAKRPALGERTIQDLQ